MPKTQNALLRFRDSNGQANAPQRYVTRALPVLFPLLAFLVSPTTATVSVINYIIFHK